MLTELDHTTNVSSCPDCHAHHVARAQTLLENWTRANVGLIDRKQMRSLVTALAESEDVHDLISAFQSRTLYPQRPAVKISGAVTATDGQVIRTPTVWLLGFRAQEATDIHDHADSEATVHVYRGTIEETIYWPQGHGFVADTWTRECKQVTRELSAPSNVTIPTPYIHRFASGCDSDKLCASIHAYYPPLDVMNLYTVDEQRKLITLTGSWEDKG